MERYNSGTVNEGFAKEVNAKSGIYEGADSYFDGTTLQFIGYKLLTALVTILTLGIAYPWMLCMMQKWQVKHTVINGRRLKFNGHGSQLIGRYLLWLFLSVITLGIYSIGFGVGMKKWVVKHTVYADDENPVNSYFSGGAIGYFAMRMLFLVISTLTLGIGTAWAHKMLIDWEVKHTHIGGSALVFNGTGGQLFGKYLLFVILTPLTLGIYALFFPVICLKWQTKHTEAVCQTPGMQAQTRGVSGQEFTETKSGNAGKTPIVVGILAGALVVALIVGVGGMWLLSRHRQSQGYAEDYYTEPTYYAYDTQPQHPESELDNILNGEWVYYSCREYNGMKFMDVHTLEFSADGQVLRKSDYYDYVGYDDGGNNTEYVNGDYWSVTGGGARKGTYSVDSDILSLYLPADGQYPEPETETYQIIAYTSTKISMQNVETRETMTFIKAA